MGKAIGKGERGRANYYITRAQAIHKLQLSINAFRRVCILKGVYPRNPPRSLKTKARRKTFYHINDINWLMHDSMIQKLRDIQIWKRKVKKAKGRRNFHLVEHLDKKQPKISFDPIIKERYPNFHDALADLDDHMNLLYLFASFPHHPDVSMQMIQQANLLAREFEGYLIMTRSLKKVFISLKGIYYQIQILGHTVVFMTPHQLGMTVPVDVDLKLLKNFADFSTKLMGFINYRLYHSLGLVYPPCLDICREDLDLGVSAFAFSKKQSPAAPSSQVDSNEEEKEEVTSSSSKAGGASLAESDSESESESEEDDDESDPFSSELLIDDVPPGVLDNCVFYLSREVPRHHFELMIRAAGGRCIVQVPGVDIDFAARGVTHYVLDRPVIPEPRVTTCDYVQPQWIPDCINAGILLPIEQYSPGTPLPPHLSPFSDDEKHGYIPERAMEIKKLQNKYKPPTPVVETLTSEQSLQAQEEAYQNELDQELGHNPQYKINPAHSSLTSAVELAESMFKPRQRFMYQKLKRAEERKKKLIKELTRKRTSRTIEAGDEAAHVPAAAPKEKLTTKYPRQPKQPRQN